MLKIKNIQPTLRRFSIVAMAIGLSLWAFPQSTQAKNNSSPATEVTITIDVVTFGGAETFTTTGDALCPSGTATTFDNSATGFGNSSSSDNNTFHGKKLLTCDDGSGTFTITFNATSKPCSPTDTGGWNVVGGTGNYVNLHGGGHLVGTVQPEDDPCNAVGIIDVYTGMVSDRR